MSYFDNTHKKNFLISAAIGAVALFAVTQFYNWRPAPNVPSFPSSGLIPIKGNIDELEKAGLFLEPDRAQALEEGLKQSPGDLSARAKLACYYMGTQFESEASHTKHEYNALWIIKNAPGSDAAGLPAVELNPWMESGSYRLGKELWIEHVRREPKNTAILSHAARYFQIPEEDRARECLERAKKVDPNNPEWSIRLGNLYVLGGSIKHGAPRRSENDKAFSEFDRARTIMGSKADTNLLMELARCAYESRHIIAAKEAAETVLARVNEANRGQMGSEVHGANLVLGRAALNEGNVAEAKRRLLLAASIPGSAPLGSFGPNMALALELLGKGERVTVLDYLKACKAFWPSPKLDQWAAEVRSGDMPDFGANLEY